MRLTLHSAGTRAVATFTTVALFAHILAVRVHASETAAMGVQVAAGRAAAERMQVAFSGGVVTITYDLVGPETGAAFNVTLDVSTNGGQTYDVQPRSMSGDIGGGVSPGQGKRIVWEVAKDVESLQTDQFRFRIVIEIVTPSESRANAPPADSSQTRPGVQPPPVTPPAVSTQVPKPSTGNRLLWPGIGMFGAGGALAALAGAGSLRKRNDYRDYYELTPNKPALYGGVGVAAAGLVLLLLGRRGAPNTASVALIPGGVMLYRATTF